MADRRRRRKRASQDSDDDDESGSGSDSGRSGSPATKNRGKEPEPPEPTVTRVEVKSDAESECESEDGVGEAVLSDYDSADPEDNGSHSEGVEEEEEAERVSDEEAPAAASESKPSAADVPPEEEEDEQQQQQQQQQHQHQGEDEAGEEEAVEEEVEAEEERVEESKEESKAEEKENLAGERQSGDGQESTDDPETKTGGKPGQKLDDDEDRKNPAFIPRKGLFFEHDVRGNTQEEERPKGRNRKLWKDEGRWEHDKFREEEQAPKSREELVAMYGYDIRNGGGHGDRTYRQRRPRQNMSPNRDKRWRDGGERPVRSWQSGGGGGGGLNRGGAPQPSSNHPSSTPPSSLHLSSAQRGSNPSRPPPSRSRPPHQSQMHLPPQSQYRNHESKGPQTHPRERQGSRAPSDPTGERFSRGGRAGGGRGGPSVVIEDVTVSQGGVRDQDLSAVTTAVASQPGGYQSASPRRHQQDHRGSTDRTAQGLAAPSSNTDPALQSSTPPVTNREASPPTERPVERKSYALARRTRSRPADLGSKQPSVEESAAGGNASSPSSVGGKSWASTGDSSSQTGGGGGGALAELDQDVARLSLAGQSWSQSPTSYIRSEMRGLPNTMHLPSGPPPFSSIEEIGVASNRAKRYSSQRQRAVPEPAPPMHLGVMEGHYYEPMSYQGPIYAHGEGPAPIPPQGMLVQPEMHLPHPGLHPHQSGGPIANPALYGGPPVSLSPGQPPQQLLPPPFYPPPGVMTFPYPTMYPTPQAQAQVTYGGVTYYDTMQQQAQPKPSPPRRTSQPVTIKPPPEVHFVSE